MDLLAQMSKDTGLKRSDLLTVIVGAPYRYKVYEVPKRNGKGTRVIAQPAKEVKLLQRWAVENVLAELPLHEHATAYEKGSSIQKNAMPHKDSSYLLKKDFKDFFPSIRAESFAEHYEKYGGRYKADDEIKLMQRVLFRRVHDHLELSIGAPSSPGLSNTILFDLDTKIKGYCDSNGIAYTRYADDLSFSTRKAGVLEELNKWLEGAISEISYPTLKFNEDKTLFLSRRGRRTVTGLVLTPTHKVSIGRKRKREIKALIHRYTLQQLTPKEVEYLRGLLSFCNDVENDFIQSLNKKYGAVVLAAIFRGSE